MKYIFISIIALSCTQPDQVKTTNTGSSLRSLDSTVKHLSPNMSAGMSDMDSALYYFTKQIDYKALRDECEIKYLRTENDKYRVMGNKYADTSHYYYLLLQKIADK